MVGRTALAWLRGRHPDLPVLVGGRNLQTAAEAARKIGAAEAVTIDLSRSQMGWSDEVKASAVVMLAPDDGLYGVQYAQKLRIPYLSIGNGLVEVGPELALFAHHAKASPIVLAAHWMAGASVFLALQSAKGFESIRSIKLGAVLDEKDPAGPAALEDMERLGKVAPALVFAGGRRTWLSDDEAKGRVTAIDGRVLDAEAFSPFDIISLHAATGAQEVRFDLATGESSSRRRGAEPAAEIMVEIEGEAAGRAKRARATLEFKHGAASLTGLSVVLLLSAILGLNNNPPVEPGLYLPELLSDPEWFLDELERAGAVIAAENDPA